MSENDRRALPRGRDAMRVPEVDRTPPTGDHIDPARQHDRLPIIQK